MAMSKLIEMPLADGGSVLVEISDTAGVPSTSTSNTGATMRGGQPAEGPVTRGLAHREPLIERGTQTLEQSVAAISPALRAVLEELRRVSTDLTQIELEVGLKLTGEAGMVLARAGTEANFQVHLTWARSPSVDAAARKTGDGGKLDSAAG
jgi:hypothetical protein